MLNFFVGLFAKPGPPQNLQSQKHVKSTHTSAYALLLWNYCLQYTKNAHCTPCTTTRLRCVIENHIPILFLAPT